MKAKKKEPSDKTEPPITHSRCYIQLLRTGATRWVIIIGNFAFKIPSLHSYKNFLWGLLSNMQESKFSKIDDMSEKVCPVIFSLPLGLLVVMPKVRVLNENELSDDILEKFCKCNENYTIPAEIKPSSFGYLDGKLVAIDFG